jgi:hypothetical protein
MTILQAVIATQTLPAIEIAINMEMSDDIRRSHECPA